MSRRIPQALRCKTESAAEKRSVSTNPNGPSSPKGLQNFLPSPAKMKRSQSQQRVSKLNLFEKAHQAAPTETYLRVTQNPNNNQPRRIKSHDCVPTDIRTDCSPSRLTSLSIKQSVQMTVGGTDSEVPSPLSMVIKDFGTDNSLSSIRESSFEMGERNQDDTLVSLLTWEK